MMYNTLFARMYANVSADLQIEKLSLPQQAVDCVSSRAGQ
jgi:hypothetical protein